MYKCCFVAGAVLAASLPADAARLQVLHSFSAAEGSNPTGHLMVDRAGNILGLTTSGGAHGNGTVFALLPPASGVRGWTLKVLHSFTKAEGKPSIFSGVSIAGDGTIYGVTSGAVFSLSPVGAGGSSTYTKLLSFAPYLGHQIIPSSSLLIGLGGALYVTDEEGGPNYAGAVYRIAQGHTGWVFSDIHDFNRTDGFYPKGNLLVDASGNIFGTTQAGGVTTNGNVYELSPPAGGGSWTVATLFSFARHGGNTPDSGLVRSDDGTIYGTTAETGFGPRGTLYSLREAGGSWSLTPLLSSRALYGSNQVLPLPDGSLLTADGQAVLRAANGNTGWGISVVARLHDRSAQFGPPVAGPNAVYYLETSYGTNAPLGRVYALTP